jgi:uncharacterized protein YcbK (DUF882 family)
MELQPTSRRGFLAGMAVAGLGLVKVPRIFAAMEPARSLSFRCVNTGEELTTRYFAAGQYLPGALHDVNHVLRDWRTNQVHPIDPELLDLVNELHEATGSKMPIELICGYRSPATNKMLASKSSKVSPPPGQGDRSPARGCAAGPASRHRDQTPPGRSRILSGVKFRPRRHRAG